MWPKENCANRSQPTRRECLESGASEPSYHPVPPPGLSPHVPLTKPESGPKAWNSGYCHSDPLSRVLLTQTSRVQEMVSWVNAGTFMGRSLRATDAKLGSPMCLKLVNCRYNKCASHSLLTRKVEVNVTQSCLTLCDPMDYTLHGILGQNTGVGSRSLLQRIFPTQGSNPGLPHCRWILYQLSYKGNQKSWWKLVKYSNKTRTSEAPGSDSRLRGQSLGRKAALAPQGLSHQEVKRWTRGFPSSI